MRALLLAGTLVAVAILGPPPARAAEPDLDKLLADCVSASALVFGPGGTKDPAPLAGALVLDRDKRLLLAPSDGVPDTPTALFPAYTAKGELVNDPAEYTRRWTKGERWAGKVIHRDKTRQIAVIELDRALPDRARAAEVLAESVPVASDVYALNQPKPGGGKQWELWKSHVRAVGDGDIQTGPGSNPAAGPKFVTAIADRGTGPDFGLYTGSGRVAGCPSPPNTSDLLAWKWLDVTELRAFLTEKKVPFRSAPPRRPAKELKAK